MSPKPPGFVMEFSVVSSEVAPGESKKAVLPYRPGELVSHVITVPPFKGGETQQAEEINAALLAIIGCDVGEYETHAQALYDAATGADNVLEGRIVECSTVEKEKKTKPGEFFTYRTFTAHAYSDADRAALADVPALLGRKGAKAPQRPAAPTFPTTGGHPLPPPPPEPTIAPWDTLPPAYHQAASASFPRGRWYDGKAWVSK